MEVCGDFVVDLWLRFGWRRRVMGWIFVSPDFDSSGSIWCVVLPEKIGKIGCLVVELLLVGVVMSWGWLFCWDCRCFVVV